MAAPKRDGKEEQGGALDQRLLSHYIRTISFRNGNGGGPLHKGGQAEPGRLDGVKGASNERQQGFFRFRYGI